VLDRNRAVVPGVQEQLRQPERADLVDGREPALRDELDGKEGEHLLAAMDTDV
jgi:hypothetical protein